MYAALVTHCTKAGAMGCSHARLAARTHGVCCPRCCATPACRPLLPCLPPCCPLLCPQLALRLHPDKNKAHKADEAFKLLSKAFSCLSSPDKRAYYDRCAACAHSEPAALDVVMLQGL